MGRHVENEKARRRAAESAPRFAPTFIPRLLGLEPDAFGWSAPGYCGISASLFLRECELLPVKIGARKLWDMRALDAWIDRLTGGGEPPVLKDDTNPRNKIRDARAKNKKPGRRPKAGVAAAR